ncbi:MAG: DUF445 family protein [Lachnospiraceae bacterium]|nr:DUF445 family protein [Lachnospiraceae bacterium]
MEFLKYAVPILVGALIGYCTNYIAIKMLFRPKNPVKIGSVKLPFTPGIIPKNQPRIAKAVGEAVGEKLFTSDDIKDVLQSEEMKSNITGSLMGLVTTDRTIEEILKGNMGDEKYGEVIDKVYDTVCDKIEEGIKEADIASIIKDAGKDAILEKVQGTMLAMFVNEDLIMSIMEPLKKAIDKYIDEHGEEKIIPIVSKEIESIEKKTPDEMLESVGISTDMIEGAITEIYDGFVNDKADEIIKKINISAIVEQKLNDMDVEEVEELVMSVMKNELQAVINLGALIGAVIGIINIFF